MVNVGQQNDAQQRYCVTESIYCVTESIYCVTGSIYCVTVVIYIEIFNMMVTLYCYLTWYLVVLACKHWNSNLTNQLLCLSSNFSGLFLLGANRKSFIFGKRSHSLVHFLVIDWLIQFDSSHVVRRFTCWHKCTSCHIISL